MCFMLHVLYTVEIFLLYHYRNVTNMCIKFGLNVLKKVVIYNKYSPLSVICKRVLFAWK